MRFKILYLASSIHAQALLDVENKINVFSAISVTTDNNGRLRQNAIGFHYGLKRLSLQKGLTPLQVAILMQRKECAIQLINELGFKGVNSINDSGITCCHIAAAAGQLTTI